MCLIICFRLCQTDFLNRFVLILLPVLLKSLLILPVLIGIGYFVRIGATLFGLSSEIKLWEPLFEDSCVLLVEVVIVWRMIIWFKRFKVSGEGY